MSAAEQIALAPTDPLIEHALFYVRRGWHVFPCNPRNKTPFVGSDKDASGNDIPKTGGLYKATTDEKTIIAWWTRWPRAMIGVRMGSVSGVWALDPDAPKQSGDPDGKAAWARLTAEHGAIHTHAHLTPGQGQHLLFAWDPDRPVTNKEGLLKGSGVNVRGEGGYIIAPPSRRQDGKTYDVVEPLDFFRFATAPDWLYDMILAKPAEASISQRAMALVQPRDRDARPYAEAALRGECDAVATSVTDRNVTLNNAAIKLGSLVGAGELSEGEVIGALYDAATVCGYVASDGQRATMATINSGLQAGIKTPRQMPNREDRQASGIFEKADVQAAASDQIPPNIIQATPYVWRDAASIPVREWIYGRLLIRKFVTATVAPGGVGKSSLVTAEALALVSGKHLLGISPIARLRVWLWNLEDPREETERKIQAAALHFKLTPDDIGDRLFVDSGRDQPLVIATTTKTGAIIMRPVVENIVAAALARQIDVLVIDPFVSCHEVNENDNTAMDMVAKEWGRVADRIDGAVHLVHHTRKMGGVEAEVTAESSRGGKALTDACRIVRAVNRMSKDEGERAGVANHRLHFRTFNDKANLAPPVEKSDWFALISVDLGNGPLGGLASGDSMGVVVPWQWPDAFADVSTKDLFATQKIVAGGSWKESPQSKEWVGIAIAEALGLDTAVESERTKIKTLLKTWIKNKALKVVRKQDDSRHERPFVEVGEWATD